MTVTMGTVTEGTGATATSVMTRGTGGTGATDTSTTTVMGRARGTGGTGPNATTKAAITMAKIMIGCHLQLQRWIQPVRPLLTMRLNLIPARLITALRTPAELRAVLVTRIGLCSPWTHTFQLRMVGHLVWTRGS